MRILHTTEFYAPSVGGCQEVVRQLSERLAARGHEVTVATTALPSRPWQTLNGVRVVGFSVEGNQVRGLRGDVEAYRRFVLDGRFDVVMNYSAQQWHTDALLDLLPDIRAAKVLVPCGLSALDRPEYAPYFKALPARLAAYDACVYLSHSTRDALFAQRHGLNNGRLIPNGAAADEFEIAPALDARRLLGLSPDTFFILSVGSHSAHKGHAEAAEILDASGIGDAALVVVGNRVAVGGRGCSWDCAWRAWSWPWRPSWRRRRLRLINTTLDRAQTLAAFRQADVFLFPSNVECSPLVLFEAAAAGLPFLASAAGNAREIADWTGGGEVMDTAFDARGMARVSIADGAARLRALRDAPARRAAMGRAGRAAWRERFTWERIAGEYEKLYLELRR